MTELLITGATGTLGRRVVDAAVTRGHRVRALSRADRNGTEVRWHRGDLLTGDGVAAAVDGVDVIVHCATQPTGDKDVTATQQLITAARRAAAPHLIYVSIVGVDRIPLPYYRTKLRVEQLLAASDVAHTVLRVIQFHDPIVTLFAVQRFLPVLCTLRGVRFQPIDTRDVAGHLLELVDGPARGRAPDIGGPWVDDHAELGQMYLAAHHSRRPLARVPVPGRTAAGFRSGANLVPANPVGTIGFADFLTDSCVG
ncbi:SDR family oxidoreductase [Mycolicibacterium thermoresistibile]